MRAKATRKDRVKATPGAAARETAAVAEPVGRTRGAAKAITAGPATAVRKIRPLQSGY